VEKKAGERFLSQDPFPCPLITHLTKKPQPHSRSGFASLIIIKTRPSSSISEIKQKNPISSPFNNISGTRSHLLMVLGLFRSAHTNESCISQRSIGKALLIHALLCKMHPNLTLIQTVQSQNQNLHKSCI